MGLLLSPLAAVKFVSLQPLAVGHKQPLQGGKFGLQKAIQKRQRVAAPES